MSREIAIAEIFGPVIQGEGPQAGLPTIFVRTGGCDFRCAWCDSLFAVLPNDPLPVRQVWDDGPDSIDMPQVIDGKFAHRRWERMTAPAIYDRILKLANGRRYTVTLSGGNPAIWDLSEVIAELRRTGFPVAIETQGTLLPHWNTMLTTVVLSPKPPSSGMAFNGAQFDAWIKARSGSHLKFVVDTDADLDFALEVRRRAMLHGHTGGFYLQPCNPLGAENGALSPDAQAAQYRWLCELALARGCTEARVIPQLHVLAYGAERAR